MRRFTVWVLAAALMMLGASATYAAKADKPKKSPEERFSKMDANADKKLSSDEFVGKKTGDKKDKAEKRFAKLDSDKDGSLSLAEFQAPPKKK
ncbi:MAG: hypothetical protein AB7O59_22210 [Pirellulales bacterium]